MFFYCLEKQFFRLDICFTALNCAFWWQKYQFPAPGEQCDRSKNGESNHLSCRSSSPLPSVLDKWRRQAAGHVTRPIQDERRQVRRWQDCRTAQVLVKREAVGWNVLQQEPHPVGSICEVSIEALCFRNSVVCRVHLVKLDSTTCMPGRQPKGRGEGAIAAPPKFSKTPPSCWSFCQLPTKIVQQRVTIISPPAGFYPALCPRSGVVKLFTTIGRA